MTWCTHCLNEVTTRILERRDNLRRDNPTRYFREFGAKDLHREKLQGQEPKSLDKLCAYVSRYVQHSRRNRDRLEIVFVDGWTSLYRCSKDL
jgi:hypothetical protein